MTGVAARNSCLGGQAHLLEEGSVAGVALQVLQQGISFQIGEPAVVLSVALFKNP